MMEKKLTLLVHPRMTQFLKSSVQMLSDGLREISIEPELIHELPPEFTGRAIVLGANFFSASALCALPYNSVIFNIENSDANFITSDYISLLRKYHVWDYNRSNAHLGQPDGMSPSRMAEMLEVDKAGQKVRC